jgi:hypothetical protein
MPEAVYVRADDRFQMLAASTYDAGQLIQLPTGEAGFLYSESPVSTGADTEDLRTRGKATVYKATGVVLLAGQEVYWDHSANNLTYQKVNDRDFYAGIVVANASSAAVSCVIDLNKRQRFDIDLGRDHFDTVLVGTQAVGGFGEPKVRGGGRKLVLSATSEAQKVDLFSRDRFALASNWIAEFLFTLADNGAGSAPALSIGVANATHATNASSIAERCFVHLDGNALGLFAESGDGTTTVALTDTTVDVTEGSAVANRVHVLMDGRDPADVQIYVNGALVLGSTVFNIAAATGPLGLLVHLEKTAAADVYEVDPEKVRVWYSEQ